MWICKEVVEQHGGRVGALSDGLHQGATFFMELPLEESYSSGGDEDLLTMRTVNVDAFKDLGIMRHLLLSTLSHNIDSSLFM